MSWAIVTASSRGIGYVVAEALAEENYSLIITSRIPERRREVVEKLLKHGARQVELLKLDLTNKKSVKEFIETAARIVEGELRVLAINYGNPSCEPCTISKVKWEDWIEAAKMYLASTSELIKMASRIESDGVRVIIISSFTTTELHPNLVLSDAIRRGLDVLVKAVAHEYPDKIFPILLLLGSFRTPGAIETVGKIAEQLGVDRELFWRKEVEARSPLNRTGGFNELKEMVKLLARSPRYLTGAKILFDGASSKAYL